MARYSVQLMPPARAWLRAEVAYLTEKNPAAAEKVLARIRAAQRTLADYPKLGVAGLIPGTRRFVVTPYVLTIRIKPTLIEIVAIGHGRQSDAHVPRDAVNPNADGEP